MNFEIRPNRKIIPLAFILSVFLCMLSYWGFKKIEFSNPIDQTYIKYIMFSFFVLGAFWGAKSLYGYLRFMLSPNAKITIDETGIDDQLTLNSFGRINWPDVKGLEIREAYHLKFLIIRIADPELFISKQKNSKQKDFRALLKKFGSPVVIVQNKINVSLEDVEIQIRKYMDL